MAWTWAAAVENGPEIYSGGRAVIGALAMIARHGPVVFFAVMAARRLQPRGDALDRAATAFLIYFFGIAASVWVLPRVGLPWLMGWSLLLGAVGVYLGKGCATETRAPILARVSAVTLAAILAVALIAVAVLGRALLQPAFEHDPLTYQLYFAASWLQAGKLSIIPTPFGDPSQAYGPALASVYYLWLMAPFGNDLWAQAGGWPFLILALIAAAGLARELGAKTGQVWSAAAFCLMAPLLVYEGRTALSDGAGAALFAAALLFFGKSIREGRGADLGLALLAAGMAAGTKYTMAPLLCLLLPLAGAAAARVRGRQAFYGWVGGSAAGGLAGGAWYLRNLIATGNPVFPFRVAVGELVLFDGLYGRREMAGWAFDYAGVSVWRRIIEINFSFALALAGALSGLVLAGVCFRRAWRAAGPERLRWLAAAYVALLPLMIDRMIWHEFPYQVYRFWLTAGPVLAAVTAANCSRRPVALVIVLAACWAGLWPPVADPALAGGMHRWLGLALPAAATAAVLITAAVVIGAKRWRGRVPGTKVAPAALAAGLLAFVVVTAATMTGYPSRRARGWEWSQYRTGWARMAEAGTGLTVAYTGANVPYPLAGPGLGNKVIYIDVSGRVNPLDHEVWREMTAPPVFHTPEPMVTNLRLCPRRWADAMVSAGVDYLFVMKVPATPLLNVAHDPAGWPVEDQWARAVPGRFRPFYTDDYTRVYRINAAGDAGPLSDACEDRPADALSCGGPASELCRRFFPLSAVAQRFIDPGVPKTELK